ncbi:hypothetical protein [Embleya hyalina]|uniref:Uncharacterized protein n=1 Tax=Embleya hyalina TaxID=516124 RepID=A0A401YPV6_9ACTN|nr:hypothetical protein EHYA_04313 [Embleya hyalina]
MSVSMMSRRVRRIGVRESEGEVGAEPRDGDRYRLTVVEQPAPLSPDAMASVAYGSEAIIPVLALAGGTGLGFTLPVTPVDGRLFASRA